MEITNAAAWTRPGAEAEDKPQSEELTEEQLLRALLAEQSG